MNSIRSTYVKSLAREKAKEGESECFGSDMSVRHGCVMKLGMERKKMKFSEEERE